jgi:hypothetical protein
MTFGTALAHLKFTLGSDQKPVLRSSSDSNIDYKQVKFLPKKFTQNKSQNKSLQHESQSDLLTHIRRK